MKRITLNFIVDFVSFIVFVGLAFTGFIIRYILPPGTGGLGRELSGGRGREEIQYFLSMTRFQWGDIHFVLSIVFIALIVIHIILHFGWIKGYFKSMFGVSQKCKSD
ncbi:MAG: hypothetical protein A2167_02120 [Planctomycetes bacterium RBG_13_46_10]|nr:MAG: hypothetical protein A2167_02120 [Planctomycetes bacterium RBG_13_46_10]